MIMFGEAKAIRALKVELIRALRESANLTATTLDKFQTDTVFAIIDSARTRDEYICNLIDSVDNLNRSLRRFFPVSKPGPLKVQTTGESSMANMLGFKLVLPELPPEPNDIVGGEVTLVIGGGDPQAIPTVKGQTEVSDLSGEEGSEVQVSFIYIDDAGNKSSSASTLTETLVDTIPPPIPGALGLAVTSEFTTADAPADAPVDAPADAPAEPPAPEPPV